VNRTTRLVGLASAVVDLVLQVDHLPEPGGDVLASATRTAVGGGLTALRAAAADGLAAVYAGGHGTGPFGDLVRAALADLGVLAALAPTPDQDSGFCVVLVDPTGERTFATTVGAEGHLTARQLGGLRLRPGDAVYLSGYDLAYPHGPVLGDAVARLPAETPVVLDPGPLVGEIPRLLLATVLGRTTWLSLNAREAARLTGSDGAGVLDPAEAAAALLADGAGRAGVVVRDGADGAVLAVPGREPARVPGVPAGTVVDTNGAGDVHVGAFVAGLARGLDPVDAVAAANAAASAWVSLPGAAR
jgi:sugar/nucleoside kinase (ribokinase family)